MATATAPTKGKNGVNDEAARQDMLPALPPPRLPYHPAIEDRFGVDKASWKALVEAVFPLATTTDSVILALSYCKARNLDPFKRNIHIVPIYNKELRKMVDTIWPGIGELRTTAFRTMQYAGRGETVFGPDITTRVGNVEMTFPEWAQVTLKRLVKDVVVEFAGPRVYWLETYSTYSRDDQSPNSMWRKRPRGQLDKCAEAAALRSAFPEELGDERTDDEVGAVTDAHLDNKKAQVERGVAALEAKMGIPVTAEEAPAEIMLPDGELIAAGEAVTADGELFDSEKAGAYGG